MQLTYQFLKDNGYILFEAIVGSQSYGTNTENSDEDRKFVFICPEETLYGFDYIEQINVNDDYVGYELKRFLELVKTNNPNILELLNSPEDCIVFKHELYDQILQNKDNFLTKQCKNSFGGYAISQLKKSTGLDKKQNWEKDKITRKDILDFIYVIEGEKSIPWKVWKKVNFEEIFCGVVNVPNARDVYAVYYDNHSFMCFGKFWPKETREHSKAFRKQNGLPMGLGYKGLVKVGEGANVAESNQLRLSSIPKGETPICTIVYNKDGYTQHCKDYKQYQEWLENRNTARYVDNKNHGQAYDSKNLMHTIRLITMAKEIGQNKGIIVKRPDREYLLEIRKGTMDLKTLHSQADQLLKQIEDIYKDCTLPESVDHQFINQLLIDIRKQFYTNEKKIN